MSKDIYLGDLLVQMGPMEAIGQAGARLRPAGEATSLGGRFFLCELALTATCLSAPAYGQTNQRVDLVGFVEARCSAITPGGMADMDPGEEVSRVLTVRCSGPSPAMSVRTHAADDPEVTLTVASARGLRTGQRLSTQEGNVVVGLADIRSPGPRAGSRGPVEIIVSPAS